MADDIEQGDNDEESGSQSGKKVGLIIAVAVLLIGGGAAGAYFMGMFDSLLGKEEHAQEEHAEEAPENAVMLDEHGNPIEAKITYYQLPEFLINLSSSTNQTSFIKMKITLKLPSQHDQLIVEERMAELQNEFNTYLRDLRASDLAGSAGMYRLQEELLARANRILKPEAQVDKILFTEILIQ
jgi:flagellar FliL protein